MTKKSIMLAAMGLVVILGASLLLNLNSVVKSLIETAGTKALGTDVRVSSLDISLAKKSARMTGLSVANPEGFKSAHFLVAKEISVALGDMTDKTVTVREVVVDGMAVTYELGAGGSNIDAIKKSMNAAASSGNNSKGRKARQGKSVVIEKIRVLHAQLIPSVAGFEKPVNLPEIVVSNIGSQAKPATQAEVAERVMGKVLAISSAAVAGGSFGAAAAATLDKMKTGLDDLLSR